MKNNIEIHAIAPFVPLRSLVLKAGLTNFQISQNT